MKSLLTWMTLGLLVVGGAVGCGTMTGKSLGQNVDDATITATVKAKLVGERSRNLTAVDVDTNQGVVYLRGNVASAEEKATAERIARSVDGVKQVVNDLMLQPRAFGTPAERSTAPSASSSTVPAGATVTGGTLVGHHAMTGEVTKLDRERGHMHLRTGEGELQLHFPPAALSNVREGDRVTVELGMRALAR